MSQLSKAEIAAKLCRYLLCLLPLVASPAWGQSPGQVFADVLVTDPDFNATTTLYQLLITKGCTSSPFDFCPSAAIQRQDMAVLIVRAWSIRMWNDPEAFQTQAPINGNAYFSDVPVGSAQFVYIQKLYELGITSGVTGPVVNSSGIVTQGAYCPNASDNGFNLAVCTAQGADEGLLQNYQIAVFIARARALSDNGCAGQYASGKPFVTSSSSSCTPNNFPSVTGERPYFADVPSSDSFFTYIQRLGDLGAFTNVYSPTPIAGGADVFGEGNLVARGAATPLFTTGEGDMAIETVIGMGLDPRTTLTFNGATGPDYTSTAVAVNVPFYYYHQDETYGANDITYAQFALADTSGIYHCYGDWGRPTVSNPSDLDLYDGNTGPTSGFNVSQEDSFCTVSLVSITNAPGSNPTGVTVVLNFSFSQGFGQTFTVMSQLNYASGYETPSFENVGSLTVQQPSGPTVLLSVVGNTGIDYQSGNTFTLTATGQANSTVAVSENGGAIVSVGTTNSTANGQGVWTATGTWGLSNVGNYTETWYVAGLQAVPGLSFQVNNGPAAPGAYTCGVIVPGRPGALTQGTPIAFTVNVAGITNLSNATVGFQVAGAITNPYQSTVPATLAPLSSSWIGNVYTAGLLGTYSATPVIVPSGGGAATTCSNAAAFFTVDLPTPNVPGPVSCASMTGTWTDSVQGQANPFTWGGIVDNGGTISNGNLNTSYCGTSVTWSTITGTHNPANGSYTLTASNPSPTSFSCSNTTYQVVTTQTKGGLQGQSCGLGNGMFSDVTGQAADTLKTERVPSGELTSSANPAWGTAYGAPTAAIFNMTLTSPSGSNYNFGGRTVEELNPVPADNFPASYAANDGCWWTGAPWLKITGIAMLDTWNVQGSGQNGSYGPDYVGFPGEWIANAQRYSPLLQPAGSSCTIQFPAKMVINQESVVQPAPPTIGFAEVYGSPGFGQNLIQYTISPTTILIGRGNASVGQGFHF